MIRGTRSGMSLVETVVAMLLMAIALIPIAGLTVLGSRRSFETAGATFRQGVLAQEVARVTSTPYAALPALAGCEDAGAGSFPYTRCITVANLSAREREVTVIVTPMQPRVRPDSVTLSRTNPPTSNPLMTP